MIFNKLSHIPKARVAFYLLLISLLGCGQFLTNLQDSLTAITKCKVLKENNPALTRDYEGYIDTYSRRIVIDFKSDYIASSVLKSIKPTIEYTAREIYPDVREGIDLNGTVFVDLTTVKKTERWTIVSCCVNSGTALTLSYTDDWTHTMGDPAGVDDLTFGDGVIKKDANAGSERLYFLAPKNIAIRNPTYIEKIRLNDGSVELSTNVPWEIKSSSDVWQSPSIVLSLTDTGAGTTYIRKLNTNTLNNTLESTLASTNYAAVAYLPNSGGGRIKGVSGVNPGDVRTYNVYNTTENLTFECGTGTTETTPIVTYPDYSRETYYILASSLNCGAASSGTDIMLARVDNNFNLLWKRVIWSNQNDLLPQIGANRSAVVLPDGSIIISRFWVSGSVQNNVVKYDLNGNDISSSSSFPATSSLFSAQNQVLISVTSASDDLFYASYHAVTGAYSILRVGLNGESRTLTFNPAFSVGCNAGQQTITVAVDTNYNLYFNCLKTNAGTGKKEMYVKKFRAIAN